jgi:hypothetical protein
MMDDDDDDDAPVDIPLLVPSLSIRSRGYDKRSYPVKPVASGTAPLQEAK